MGIIIDIVLVALLALSVILGYKKGFVKVAVKLLALIIAIVVTFLLYKPVSKFIIEKTEIDDKIEQTIVDKATQKIEEGTEEEEKDLINTMTKFVENSVAKAQNDIVKEYSVIIAEKIIEIGTIIGLFILTRLVLILLVLLSDAITSLPIIKQFNKLGGIIYGILRGLIIIYIALAIVYFITTTSVNTEIMSYINTSIITKFMYNNNILLSFII